jgi:hypothetical protein
MKRAHLRIRLWTASILLGCTIAYTLKLMTAPGDYGYYFPGTQPGWLLAWSVARAARQPITRELSVAIVTVGNAFFYSLLTLRIVVADLLSRGRLGQILLGRTSSRNPKHFAYSTGTRFPR